MSENVKRIKENIKKAGVKLDSIEENVARVIMSFNSLLREITTLNCAVNVTQEVRPDKFQLNLTLEVIPSGENRKAIVPVGWIEHTFPVPSGEEICNLINDYLKKQVTEEDSCLLCLLAFFEKSFTKPKIIRSSEFGV